MEAATGEVQPAFPRFDEHSCLLFISLKAAPGRISFTVDCWSSSSMDAYISVTAHYISAVKGWVMDDELAAFKYVRGSHSGENLARVVINSLDDLGITKKVFIPPQFTSLRLANKIIFSTRSCRLGGSQLITHQITTP